MKVRYIGTADRRILTQSDIATAYGIVHDDVVANRGQPVEVHSDLAVQLAGNPDWEWHSGILTNLPVEVFEVPQEQQIPFDDDLPMALEAIEPTSDFEPILEVDLLQEDLLQEDISPAAPESATKPPKGKR